MPEHAQQTCYLQLKYNTGNNYNELFGLIKSLNKSRIESEHAHMKGKSKQ